MLNAQKSADESSALWNVIEQHLEEGVFAYRRWAHSLDSPNETLETVRHTHEERLKAHIDGLCVGGRPVADRALEPELIAPPEPQVDRCTVAALAMLEQGAVDSVRTALGCTLPVVRLGAERALAMAGPPQVGHWLRSELQASLPATRRAELLRIASVRRISLLNLLEPVAMAAEDSV